MRWVRWIELVVGVWLVGAPFVIGYTGSPYWNDILIGLLAIVITAVGWNRRDLWWTASALGVWLLIAPLVLGYTGVTGALWNDLLAGIVLVAAGTARGHRARRAEERAHTV